MALLKTRGAVVRYMLKLLKRKKPVIKVPANRTTKIVMLTRSLLKPYAKVHSKHRLDRIMLLRPGIFEDIFKKFRVTMVLKAFTMVLTPLMEP